MKNNRPLDCFAFLLTIFLTACTPVVSGVPTQISPPVAAVTSEIALPTILSHQPSTAPVEPSVTPAILPPAPTPSSTKKVDSVVVLPDTSDVSWVRVAEGLDKPIGVTHAKDGSRRLFIVEQQGRILIWQDGSTRPEPFLDIRSLVACCGERGLLGLAFHPNYAENGQFYVYYTEQVGGTLFSVISRYFVSPDANRADPASERRLLTLIQPYDNHNGGQLAFGPDGYLYIGLGDGGAAGDPLGNAQSLQTLLGKILRIDVDKGEPYAIPPDNPFTNSGGLPEIWLYGLRNPWRFSFDRLTGDLYIGDVGQGQWEEIDFWAFGQPGGANFGWDYYEGNHPYEGTPPLGFEWIGPAAEYPHSLGVSVTGGYVYRGTALPNWQGVYLYGDYGSGKVWGLLRLANGEWENALLFETGARITSFGEDEEGELYLVDYSGVLFRLERK